MISSEFGGKPSIFNRVGTGKIRFHHLDVLCARQGRNGVSNASGRRMRIPRVGLIDALFHPDASRGKSHKVPVRTGHLRCDTFYFKNEPDAHTFAVKVDALAHEHNRIEDVLSKNRNRRDILKTYASNVIELHRTSPLLSGKHIKTRR